MTAIAQQVLEFVSQESPLDLLDDETLKSISHNSSLIYLTEENKQTLLETQQDYLYLIQNGQFAVKDCEAPIKHLSDGDYFGYPNLLTGKQFTLQLAVDSPGLILCIPKDYFIAGLENTRFKAFFEASVQDALHNHALADSDSMWLYKPLHEVAVNPPLTVEPDISVQSAAATMCKHGVSSLLVAKDSLLIGIVTDRDIRNRVVAQGLSTQLPIKQFMTENPAFLTKNKTIFDAICLMNDKGIHHIPILDAHTKALHGVVTNTDIARQQRTNVMFAISDISKSADIESLINNSRSVPQYIASMAKRAGDYDIAGKVLAQATDTMTRKLIKLFQQEHGIAPIKYCWLVYGSQAREDQTMGSDQDNALLLATEPNEQQAEYFEKFSQYVCTGLDKCGIKLCDGNIMASNPELRLSLLRAKEQTDQWVNSPTNQAIMHFNIYLDGRAVAGDNRLFDELQQYRKPLLKNSMFLAALARNLNQHSVPLSIFQKFVYAKHQPYKDSIDLKKTAVVILNGLVRLYALESELSLPSTLARLKNLPTTSDLSTSDRSNLRDIWLLLNRLRWRHQLTNNVDDNFIRISDLSSFEKHQLKAAFQAIHRSQQAAVLKFSGGIG